MSTPEHLVMSASAPCGGTQSLYKVVESLYQGTTGDFTVVSLNCVNLEEGTTWILTVFDYGGSGSCYGTRQYRRNPAGADPRGNYCRSIDGALDCNAGQAGVTDT
jgi:hypothetical protein